MSFSFDSKELENGKTKQFMEVKTKQTPLNLANFDEWPLIRVEYRRRKRFLVDKLRWHLLAFDHLYFGLDYSSRRCGKTYLTCYIHSGHQYGPI